ncbi:Fic family protein [Alloscardovia criceti]|uniref:Fic family protein n=1 Tax=Alloscardovia criceti TaxID=356828 RepID=UPI00036D5DE3|nr:Fic family protein [Alloscardovia criceti]
MIDPCPPPAVFTHEQIVSLAETICSWQAEILKDGQGLSVKKDNLQGNVESVIRANFGVYFSQTPQQNHGFVDIFDQIARFASHLANDHIFPDANKRTTVISCLSLLYKHDIILDMKDTPNPLANTLYQWIQDVVEGKTPDSELAEELRSHAAPLNPETF